MTEQEIPVEERSTTAEPATGWHPVNVGHLVMGTAFVGLFVVWALVDMDAVDLADTGWLLPLPWLVAGVVGLVATVLRNVGRRPGKMSGWI
ncbi:hypothetical protein [Nocardioides bizhenqiangii]|uniref:DUF2530 domain-containing protein n=1 Tax=Nocardioides bizhenqiangii TaxID=3095076 RepID=A0ABZ0ZN74_9ACTN|nr:MULTISPECIES: hypothetical protein [unclassified Nocardioides]MDZ5621480.1 hypothetical protein [Nocardioides sp. HM23]WQQ25683.1 hypothetical protein SHK19_17160 [Nocardioides sp. HM61]